MADKVALDVGGKERVAMEMAYTIIVHVEDKSLKNVTREEYLTTVVQCVDALKGVPPR